MSKHYTYKNFQLEWKFTFILGTNPFLMRQE